MYSTLAGFIEAGESAEEALIREVKEEVNVQVSDIKYFSSQSQPFRAQLMLGYFCKYIKGVIALNDMELEDARWFNIKDLPIIPPDTSISGQLIRSYIEDHSKLQQAQVLELELAQAQASELAQVPELGLIYFQNQ